MAIEKQDFYKKINFMQIYSFTRIDEATGKKDKTGNLVSSFVNM